MLDTLMHLRNLEFWASDSSDLSVSSLHPPTLRYRSWGQFSERAMTASSVMFKHLRRYTVCKQWHDWDKAMIPEMSKSKRNLFSGDKFSHRFKIYSYYQYAHTLIFTYFKPIFLCKFIILYWFVVFDFGEKPMCYWKFQVLTNA